MIYKSQIHFNNNNNNINGNRPEQTKNSWINKTKKNGMNKSYKCKKYERLTKEPQQKDTASNN